MFSVLVRAVFMYLLVLTSLRISGKKQLSQLQPYELALTLVIAELAAAPMGDNDLPLLYGILPILALTGINAALAMLSFKSDKVREGMGGKPSILIRNGAIDEKELGKLAFPLAELMEQVRLAGVESPAEVAVAVLETGGGLSVFPMAQKRAATPDDLGFAPTPVILPVTLIIDGAVQRKNLGMFGRDGAWLEKRLAYFSAKSPSEVLWAIVDGADTMIVQTRRKGELQFLPNAGLRKAES